MAAPLEIHTIVSAPFAENTYVVWLPGRTDALVIDPGLEPEAILAFLAIIIWHMYNVHFSPAAFPMSKVWLTGKISREQMMREHPLEYEALQKKLRDEEGS